MKIFQTPSKSELIEEYLRDYLKDKYRPGEKIPSELQISKQLGISRTTIHKVLFHLTGEGMLVRKNGVGTFIAEPQIRIFTIGLICAEMDWQVPGLHPSGFNTRFLLDGFLQEGRGHPLKTELIYLHPDEGEAAKAVEALLVSSTCDAFLFPSLGGYCEIINALVAHDKLCIVRGPKAFPGAISLWAEPESGLRQALVPLLRSTVSSIVWLKDSQDNRYHNDKLKALNQICTEEGVAFDDIDFVTPTGDFEFESYIAFKDYLSSHPVPDLLISSTDRKAFGAMQALREQGVDIPSTTRIISFDNVPACDRQSPPLSSIDYPYAAMGRMIARLCIDALVDGKNIGQEHPFSCTFCPRGTT